MRVGVPTETKTNEFRVAITPAGVAELVRRGHDVLVQTGAGEDRRSPTPSSRRRARNSPIRPNSFGATPTCC